LPAVRLRVAASMRHGSQSSEVKSVPCAGSCLYAGALQSTPIDSAGRASSCGRRGPKGRRRERPSRHPEPLIQDKTRWRRGMTSSSV
jgi:hypothetical protein